jgi:hypothetical protein
VLPAVALRRLVPALLGLTLALLAAGAAVAAPKPATIGGVLSSGTTALPAGAKDGRAQILALSPDTGAYGAADVVGRRGAYRLRVAPGRWALVTSVLRLGDPIRSFLSATITARAGEQRTLPVTLKTFKKPRKAKHKSKAKRKSRRTSPKRSRPRGRAANVNPRDGRSYAGEAVGVTAFSEDVRLPDLHGFGKFLPSMLIGDLFETETRCPMTIVEMEHRAEILQEIALSQSEWVDPDTRVEPGHLIDPDILVRGTVREQDTTPASLRVTAYLEDARTGARLPGEVHAVTLLNGWTGLTAVLAERLMHDLICPRQAAAAAAPAPAPTATPAPPAPPPPPPAPRPVNDTYSGSFSGTAEAIGAPLRWSWTGTVALEAVQDGTVGPAGSPPGNYRSFVVSSGSAQLHVEGGDASCGWSGDAAVTLAPGFATGGATVQTEVASPAYDLVLAWDGLQTISAARSGTDPECTGTVTLPILGLAWAMTTAVQTSPTTTLSSSASSTYTGYALTTHWALAPG